MAKSILVAVDGSDHADKAIEMAADLAAKYGGSLRIAHVLKRMVDDAELKDFAAAEHLRGSLTQIEDQIAAQILERAREQAVSRGVAVGDVQTVLLEGDPASELLKLCEESACDIVVLGSRGLSDAKGFLLGSVSHKVGNLASCTVVTVK